MRTSVLIATVATAAANSATVKETVIPGVLMSETEPGNMLPQVT